MHCPSCGFENPDGLKFCTECGAALKWRCAQCDFENAPQAKFCRECGTALGAAGKRLGAKRRKRQGAKKATHPAAPPTTAKPHPAAPEAERRQSARSLELRAVMSLSRLWQQQGKKDEARQMLTEIYNWLTEGFDTKDSREAKVLLEELSH